MQFALQSILTSEPKISIQEHLEWSWDHQMNIWKKIFSIVQLILQAVCPKNDLWQLCHTNWLYSYFLWATYTL